MEPWLITLMWVLWLGTAAQCALAVNAYLVESREGMRISSLRVGILAGTLIIASVLAISVTFLPRQAPPLAVSPKNAAQVNIPDLERSRNEETRIRAQLDEIQKQQRQLEEKSKPLQKQQRDLEQHINLLTGAGAVRIYVHDIEEIDWRTRATVGLVLLACMLVAGFAVLALGGRIQTLLPESWDLLGGPGAADYESHLRDLDALSALVWSDSYREALEKAGSIQEKKLHPFDLLDFYFLRGYSAVQVAAFPKPEDSDEQRRKWLDMAVADLEAVTEEAPKRGEAVYTLAIAYGLRYNKHAEALQTFERARQLLPSEKTLPFDHNESVCLLKLAEASLSAGNTEQAEAYFARVATLGKLTDSVVQSRIRIGMINLRNAMNKQDTATASAALERMSGLTNLNQQQKSQVDVICSALNARIALRRDDAQVALDESTNFLTRYLPSGLPPFDEETADEPFSAVLDDDIPFPREVFQGFLFIQAVALSRIETKRRTRPTEAQLARLAEPLLRALQFVPRHRDILGALGGLYYWFRREKRDKARDWLEAAAAMGVHGRIVRTILERDRLIEMERREALDWFRSASSRFLRDPALASDVRRALVEELGRFQEFEPMLISLQEKPELEQEEPTIQGLRDRAGYLTDLLANVARSGQPERFTRLAQIHGEYAACLSHLEQTAQTISTLERRVFTELADTLTLG